MADKPTLWLTRDGDGTVFADYVSVWRDEPEWEDGEWYGDDAAGFYTDNTGHRERAGTLAECLARFGALPGYGVCVPLVVSYRALEHIVAREAK